MVTCGGGDAVRKDKGLRIVAKTDVTASDTGLISYKKSCPGAELFDFKDGPRKATFCFLSL